MPLLRLMAQASTLGIANVEKVQKQAFNPTGIKNVPASPTKVPKPLHSEASSSYGLSTKPIVIKIVEYTNSPDASDVAAQTDNKNSTKTGRQPVEAKTQGSAPKTKAAKEKEKAMFPLTVAECEIACFH